MNEETAKALLKQLTEFNRAVAAQARSMSTILENMSEMLKSFNVEEK